MRQPIDLPPTWIEEPRQARNSTRIGLLDKALILACGSVRGLDIGCGEESFFPGRLIAHGPERVLGVDFLRANDRGGARVRREKEQLLQGRSFRDTPVQ